VIWVIHTQTAKWLCGSGDVQSWEFPLWAEGVEAFDDTFEIKGARVRNLKGFDLSIQLRGLVVISGPSGSGKSTLLQQLIIPYFSKNLAKARQGAKEISGGVSIERCVTIFQKGMAKHSRSNLATFTGIMTLIRQLFAQTAIAKQRGYEAKRFSSNVKGGRCEKCLGSGKVQLDLQFMGNAVEVCDACGGTGYNRETLQVSYRGRNIAQVLEMSVSEACSFFEKHKKIRPYLEMLSQLGLGYLKLNQPSDQFSGGEAQRLQLANELANLSPKRTLYVLDEPTTGLHFNEVARLVAVLEAIVEKGHCVMVVEHHEMILEKASQCIKLGPGGGRAGGELLNF